MAAEVRESPIKIFTIMDPSTAKLQSCYRDQKFHTAISTLQCRQLDSLGVDPLAFAESVVPKPPRSRQLVALSIDNYGSDQETPSDLLDKLPVLEGVKEDQLSGER